MLCKYTVTAVHGDEPKRRQCTMNSGFIRTKQENKTHEGAKQTKQGK